MAERMRASTRRYASLKRVVVRSLSFAVGKGKREAAHVIIPVLSILLAAAIGAFVFENEVVGTLIGALAGFVLYLVLFGVLNLRKAKRAVESEYVPGHDEPIGASICLNLDVKQEAPYSELSCVVVDGRSVRSPAPATYTATVQLSAQNRGWDWFRGQYLGAGERCSPPATSTSLRRALAA